MKNIESLLVEPCGTINIIKDFIERYPDNWKLMEVQYPLMAYLIYSRSFSLIKYILFGINDHIIEKLHKPQIKYALLKPVKSRLGSNHIATI
jgi:hypothetical protein